MIVKLFPLANWPVAITGDWSEIYSVTKHNTCTTFGHFQVVACFLEQSIRKCSNRSLFIKMFEKKVDRILHLITIEKEEETDQVVYKSIIVHLL